ncbi:hypothetical protein ACFQY7_07700 [Actinomadura luteofluorescens]|uniref:hypothetical protein n=1 Tax=Actinomadura luteofluorescens TaxID=46163 RepID=UPI003640C336
MASEGIFRFMTVRPARKQATHAGLPVMVESSGLYRRLAEAAAAGAGREGLREIAATGSRRTRPRAPPSWTSPRCGPGSTRTRRARWRRPTWAAASRVPTDCPWTSSSRPRSSPRSGRS